MVLNSFFIKCLTSPALYMLYNPRLSQWEKYAGNRWEAFGDRIISSIVFFSTMGVYASPILLTILYKKGYVNLDGAVSLGKLSVGLGVILGTSLCIRSYGRSSNIRYREFVRKLDELRTSSDKASSLKAIKQFDFDYTAWPVEFEFTSDVSTKFEEETGANWRSTISRLIKSPCSLLGYLVLHTVGIRLLYPGSMTFLNYLLDPVLLSGRKFLVEGKQGERFKLKTGDGNYIDVMFVDKRTYSKDRSKDTLVICSEGNAGFYEQGIMPTAIEAGFSVLGWNHPGFGCSTGMPYPAQEQNAIETVIQFAHEKLGFENRNVILYGWSIGGYVSSWAAKHHPSVKTVILDASFDDVLPLALNQMPSVFESLVRLTIRCYADLNVARLLVDYTGPIRLVRRSKDEIISIEPENMSSNRGNYLLVKILKRRYPALFNNASESALSDWLDVTDSEREILTKNFNVNATQCGQILTAFKNQHGRAYPWTSLGKSLSEEQNTQLLLFLADVYMKDYNSTHCTPLPANLFIELIQSSATDEY